MRCYTLVTAPFRFGATHQATVADLPTGPTYTLPGPDGPMEIATVQNPNTERWHAVWVETGAFVGVAKTEADVIAQVATGLSTADSEQLTEFRTAAARHMADAPQDVDADHFWSRFK